VKYKAVIFDLFGTLVDVYDPVAYYSVLREMMSILKTPDDDFIRLWHDTSEQRTNGVFRTLEENLEHICRELKVPVTKSQINLATWVRFDYVALALTPKQDAIEVLSQMKSEGYKIGLISNCSAEPPVIWPRTPFAPYFDATIFSSTSHLRKPDPGIYQLALDKLDVKACECLYIGDGDSNELEGAESVGMNPVLVNNPDENKYNSIAAKPKEKEWHGPVIISLKEVLNLL
jgi:putative hydrolase of the HAD superfamily